ncbi:MAG: divergent polysaccharide deacetylase family protein [Sneathiella sp.]
MPTPRKRVSALPVFYSLLALALAGGAGWLFWLDLQTDHASPSAAVTLIAAPEKPDEHHEEEASHAETDKKAHPKKEDQDTDQVTSDHAETKDESHEAPSHDESSQIGEKESHPPEEDNTSAAKHADEQPQQAPVTEHQEEHASEVAQDPTPAPAAITEPEAKTEPALEKAEAVLKPAPEPEANVTQDTEPKPADVAALPKGDVLLSPVPDPDLTKSSDYGLLPIIGPTGKLPWRIYSRPFDDPLDRPRIAIIMSEMGMSKSATKSAIQNLPGPITLSFNPYARDLQSWIEQARAAGHEVLLQLPMEPFGYPKNDPGPQSLLTSLSDRENLKRLDWMLGRFAGYTGVTNQMGSKFTASEADIRPILDVIKSRGLLFLDSRTSAKSVAGQVASTTGIPVAINNRFLDHKADRTTIDSRLKDLERIARYTGTAVGVGYPYPVTLERISHWARTLARKGFVLVPVSAAINRQEIR